VTDEGREEIGDKIEKGRGGGLEGIKRERAV
jgi:hypothetical protein